MNPTTALLTADDLLSLPDDGMRHELIKGELRTMPPAGFEHGVYEIKLASRLTVHVESQQLGTVVGGDTGFIIENDPDTVRSPDIGFVSKKRIDNIGIPKKYFPGAPDLAVEIVSPSDIMNEVDEKVEMWLERGAAMVWVVNPRRKTVMVYHAQNHPTILTVDDLLDGQEVIPGFHIQVRDIFA
jgi:Uma2 family endonuclease